MKELLTEAQLPTEDITPEHLEHFFGAQSEQGLEGVVGLELYGSVALLRSLAVRTAARGLGVGAELVSKAEHYALEKGARSLFLLTMTAKAYFETRVHSHPAGFCTGRYSRHRRVQTYLPNKRGAHVKAHAG